MNMPEASFLAWLKQFNTEDDCLTYWQKMKWSNGFICPNGGNDHCYEITSRHLCECTECRKQTSVMAGTLFHGSKITLIQWFGAIDFLGSDKGSISALRLRKLIEVN